MSDIILIREDPGEHRLGWHRHHKPTNRAYAITDHPAFSAGPIITKRWPTLSAPLNQGNIGQCVGFASTAMCATPALRKAGQAYDYGCGAAIYHQATVEDGIPGTFPPNDTGSTTVGGLGACRTLGLIDHYRWAFGYDEGIQTLCYVGPIITGVQWLSGFDQPSGRGELVLGGFVRGGHEMCADAVVVDSSWDGGLYVEGWQSWGAWGPIGGRWRMAGNTWRYLLSQGGEVGVGLGAASPAPGPAPPPTPGRVFVGRNSGVFHDIHGGIAPARYYEPAQQALAAGFRPCRICRPMGGRRIDDR